MVATSSWLSALTLTAACGSRRDALSFHCCQINPFKMIASNYTDAKIREYKGKKHYELNPHVFALVSEESCTPRGVAELEPSVVVRAAGT